MRVGFKFSPGQNLVVRAYVDGVQVGGDLLPVTEWAPGRYKADIGIASTVADTFEGQLRIYNLLDNSLVVTFPQHSTFVESSPGSLAPHGVLHRAGGADAIKLDDLATPDDNTDLNASSSRHGLLPKLPNTGTKFLRDDGTFQTIAGGGDMLTATYDPNTDGKIAAAQLDTGSTNLTVCIGNDARLSNARTPTAHAGTHVTGGGDTIANAIAGGNAGLMSGADKTKLDGVAASANNYVHPNHTGDVTSVADGAQTIVANAVTNAKAAQMATKTYKGRTSALTGNAEDVAVATLKTDLGLVKADVGLGSVDNTADSAKQVSTAQQTALDLKADSNVNASYRSLLQATGSHIAGRIAGTYGMGLGDPLAISGTGTLYPLAIIHIVAADYPTINGLAPKLRIRAQVAINDAAPTGNLTFGLYPITRPGTSGGTGLNIYTLGTVVAGSNGASFTTPAADALLGAVGADFALPADGFYVIGVVTTQTVAANSHVHAAAILQMRNA